MNRGHLSDVLCGPRWSSRETPQIEAGEWKVFEVAEEKCP